MLLGLAILFLFYFLASGPQRFLSAVPNLFHRIQQSGRKRGSESMTLNEREDQYEECKSGNADDMESNMHHDGTSASVAASIPTPPSSNRMDISFNSAATNKRHKSASAEPTVWTPSTALSQVSLDQPSSMQSHRLHRSIPSDSLHTISQSAGKSVNATVSSINSSQFSNLHVPSNVSENEEESSDEESHLEESNWKNQPQEECHTASTVPALLTIGHLLQCQLPVEEEKVNPSLIAARERALREEAEDESESIRLAEEQRSAQMHAAAQMCEETLEEEVDAEMQMINGNETVNQQSIHIENGNAAYMHSEYYAHSADAGSVSIYPAADVEYPMVHSNPLSFTSPSHMASMVQALRFSLHPSAYRSYHSRIQLITSVEHALEPMESDVESHMWASEQRYAPYPYYLAYQTYVDATMRPVLMNWLMEVSSEFTLCRETLYLAINFVDRFLSLCPPRDCPLLRSSPNIRPSHYTPFGMSHVSIDRTSLQLLGLTALFIAIKLEEMHPPPTDEMIDTTANAANVEDLFGMEKIMLHVLGWKLHPQTPVSWLKLFIQKTAGGLHEEFKSNASELFVNAANPAASEVDQANCHTRFADLQLKFLETLESLLCADLFVKMMELIDMVTLHQSSLRFYPSQLAAAALFVYHPIGSPLHAFVVRATGYAFADLLPAVHALSLFIEMDWVGQPSKASGITMTRLGVPQDEFYMRQVHNPHAIEWYHAQAPLLQFPPNFDQESNLMHAAGDDPQLLAAASAAVAEKVASAVPATNDPHSTPPHCHINVEGSIPPFLHKEAVLAEMIQADLLRPIRNQLSFNRASTEQVGVWENHNDATCAVASDVSMAQLAAAGLLTIVQPQESKLGHQFAAPIGLDATAYPSAYAAPAYGTAAASVASVPLIMITPPTPPTDMSVGAAAAGFVSDERLLVEAPPVVAPASDAFLVAAATAYTPLPPNAPYVGANNQANKSAAAVTVPAPIPAALPVGRGSVSFTNNSNGVAAAAARAAAPNSSTTVYTFGAFSTVPSSHNISTNGGVADIDRGSSRHATRNAGTNSADSIAAAIASQQLAAHVDDLFDRHEED
jgi:hypothetical protein